MSNVGSRFRKAWDVWGHIDTASNLPTWFTLAKLGTGLIASFITAKAGVAQSVPLAYLIVAVVLAFASMLAIWH